MKTWQIKLWSITAAVTVVLVAIGSVAESILGK